MRVGIYGALEMRSLKGHLTSGPHMNLSDILQQFQPGADTHHISIPSSWHQGRTAYGGLSSVLAYQAALLVTPDLPPLQSAQIAFAGPLSGDVSVSASVLRRGRNTAFVKSEISSAADTGLSCTFIFMSPRAEQLDYEGMKRPDFPPLPLEQNIRSGPAEFFTGQMQYPDKRLNLDVTTPRLANWHRLTERAGLNPMAELLCMGDALPPSSMGLLNKKSMISSMNWQVNMITPTPSTKDGWWFLESETHHAGGGGASQYMTVWNSDGEPMMTGMQSVAIFL
jgi:acyl-CoA thioesterase